MAPEPEISVAPEVSEPVIPVTEEVSEPVIPISPENENAEFPNNDDIPDFMRKGGAKKTIPPGMNEDDVKAAEAFKKPTDDKAIKVKKYFIEKLKLADADVFNYSTAGTGERGYVSHCAANESRQPIVLDKDEYNEMRRIYEDDNDLDFIVYPDESSKEVSFPRRKGEGKGEGRVGQPSKDENESGTFDGTFKDPKYPSDENKEIITLVKYGSKAKRVNYYFCPRLFCIRDRLMVRYKDFKSPLDRKGSPKPPYSCPFCKGVKVDPDAFDKDSDRDPNMTVLERKTRPGSETERQIYIGFLEKKKNPAGMSLPCCFADPNDRFTSDHNDEFAKLGLPPIGKVATKPAVAPKPLPKPVQPVAEEIVSDSEEPVVQAQPVVQAPTVVQAQPVADLIMGKRVLGKKKAPIQKQPEEMIPQEIQLPPQQQDTSYEPDYFRVKEGVSVKAIVDANRIPLEIIVPKPLKPGEKLDPKSGPQIGLLPEALDEYFEQDSKSNKFAERDIVRKLKPNAKGFLRLGVDNTDLNEAFLSALVPFFLAKGKASTLVDRIFKTQIKANKFLEMNSGNLVHEFYNKCPNRSQNEMRAWVLKNLPTVDKISSTNIPAIERLMNSYECFRDLLFDPNQKKDINMLYQALAEPGFTSAKGLLLIVLEVSVEETTIKKGSESELKRDIKFERVRCPPYPITEAQKQSNIGFLVHYTKVTRDKSNPDKKIFKNYGWEPLLYVDGISTDKGSRHRPKLFFQRSEEADWPPIVKKRVDEFFQNCSNKRGPFTSQFGFDPYSLITASDLVKSISILPNGIIRDSYNHMVGIAYRVGESSELVSVPISDDGSMYTDRHIFFDWDDFTPAPADIIVDFYRKTIMTSFPQFADAYKPRRLRTQDNVVVGVELQNRFVIPAKDPLEAISELQDSAEIHTTEWENNKNIAYDSKMRRRAFELAGAKDDQESITLEASSIQDEIEDVYQHLRLSFSSWLSRGSGRERRIKIESIIKAELPLSEKRKRLDILLEGEIIRWMEPKGDETTELGFLRVDCLTQPESSCSGRCKWTTADKAGQCRIHTPATIRPNGSILHVPRMLYLRLIDELIRFATRRQEIFDRKVPRLTIRQEAQRIGDQYIIPEGSPDWNTWWELLRSEWFSSDMESKVFDEQFDPIPEV